MSEFMLSPPIDLLASGWQLFDIGLIHKIGLALLHSIWQFALISLVLFFGSRFARNTSPNFRYCLATSTLFCMPLFFCVTMYLSVAPQPQTSQTDLSEAGLSQPGLLENSAAPSLKPTNPDSISTPTTGFTDPPVVNQTATNHSSRTWAADTMTFLNPWLPSIVLAWLLGISIMSLRPLLGFHKVKQLRSKKSTRLPAEIQELFLRTARQMRVHGKITARATSFVDAPVMIGFLKPLVLLPTSAITGLETDQLQALFAHELAHVRRHDYLFNIVQTTVETILFYHPCVWWVSRLIREEREHCCDDAAIRFGNRSDYANTLLTLEKLRTKPPEIAMSARGGSLVRRVRRLAGANDTLDQPAAFGWAASTMIVAVCLSFLFMNSLSSSISAQPANRTVNFSDSDSQPAQPLEMELATGLQEPSTNQIVVPEKSETHSDERKISGQVYRYDNKNNHLGSSVKVELSLSTATNRLATNLDDGQIVFTETVKTEANGKYSVSIPSRLDPQIPQLRVKVSTHHLNYLPRTFGPIPLTDLDGREITELEPQARFRCDARRQISQSYLREGIVFSGKIELPDGTKAVGAEITTTTKIGSYAWKFPPAPTDYVATNTTITDAAGNFSLLTDSEASMVVVKKGTAPLIVKNLSENLPTKGAGRPVFRMPISIRPRGRVSTQNGDAIPYAIVDVRKSIPQALRMQRWLPVTGRCLTDENGEYELPPLPPGEYLFAVNSTIDAKEKELFLKTTQSGSNTSATETPLEHIIAPANHLISAKNTTPTIDLQAVPTNTIKVNVENNVDSDALTQASIWAIGQFNGQRWLRNYATQNKDGDIFCKVPQGVEQLKIATGLSYLKEPTADDWEIAESFYIGTVKEDLTGFQIRKIELGRLDVKAEFPNGFDVKKGVDIKVDYVNHVVRYDKRQFSRRPLFGTQRSYVNNIWRFSGHAVPGKPIHVVVKEGEITLHDEIVTLDPGKPKTIRVVRD